MSDAGKLLEALAPLFDEGAEEVRINGDVEAARAAARLLYVDGLLHEAFSAAVPRRRGVFRWWMAGLAAAAAAAAIVVWVSLPTDAPRLEEAVRVTMGGREAVAGDAISPGDEIHVGESARIVFSDGTRLALRRGTRSTVESDTRIRVLRGTAEATVTPRAEARMLVFVTPHGEARVLGTTLRLEVAAASTRLDVEQGKVRFTRPDGQAANVTGGQYVVAAPGVEFKPRQLTKGASLAARMAPGSWLSIPDTPMRPVAVTRKEHPNLFPSVAGPGALFSRSGGGALDTLRNRLYVWGGGFNHYHGNELYAFDLEGLAWQRLTQPHPSPALNQEVNPDGTPVSRDVFGGLAYLAHADRLFACGGFLAGAEAERARYTWTFDPASKKWRNMEPSGTLPPTGAYNFAVYDPQTRKVWWGDGNTNAYGLYAYDYDANSWTRITRESLSHYAAALDSRRRQLVFVGQGRVFSYDLAAASPARTPWTTTGGGGFLDQDHIGFDYDPVADKFVGWGGEAVHVLDPATKTWTTHDLPGGPPSARREVIHRWRYVPSLGVFVAAVGIDSNVYFFKTPESTP